MRKSRHLLQSSIIVIFLFSLAKVAGLVRTQLLGRAFGTGPEFDAFTAANQLPEVFVTLLAGGALAAAFIPVYSAYLTDKKQKEALKIANSILTLVFLLLGTVSLLGVIFSPWLTSRLLVPNFSPNQQALTASLMQIILLQTTLFGISGVISSILNARQHFTLPALAPLMLDVGYLIGIFFFMPALGIHGIAWGTVVGGVLHILVQMPALIRYRFRFRPRLYIHLAGVQEIIKLMGPRIVTLGAIQVADLFIIRLLSGMPEGSTSGYFYGYYLMQLPETLLGTAIAIVVFPTMAEHFNQGNIEALKRTAISALRIIWTLTIPAAVGLILIGKPTITLAFQRGEFDADSTRLVYGILVFFTIRIVAEATLEIVARLLYAQHDTKSPLFAYLAWLIIHILLMGLFFNSLGAQGIALASSIAFVVLAGILYRISQKRLGGLGERELLITGGRAILAATGMSVVILLVGRWVESGLILIVGGGSAGIFVYFLLIHFLGGKEISTLLHLLRRQQTP